MHGTILYADYVGLPYEVRQRKETKMKKQYLILAAVLSIYSVQANASLIARNAQNDLKSTNIESVTNDFKLKEKPNTAQDDNAMAAYNNAEELLNTAVSQCKSGVDPGECTKAVVKAREGLKTYYGALDRAEREQGLRGRRGGGSPPPVSPLLRQGPEAVPGGRERGGGVTSREQDRVQVSPRSNQSRPQEKFSLRKSGNQAQSATGPSQGSSRSRPGSPRPGTVSPRE
jgi:hypothetical protein